MNRRDLFKTAAVVPIPFMLPKEEIEAGRTTVSEALRAYLDESSLAEILTWFYPMTKELWEPLSEEQRKAVWDVPRQAATEAIGRILVGAIPDVANPPQRAILKTVLPSIRKANGW